MAKRLLTTRDLRERYHRSNRTFDRWIVNDELGFPKPTLINSRRYWDEAEIEAWERSFAADRKAVAA